MTDFAKWIDLAKEHKMRWVETTELGDMPPTVFAERNGRVVCAVVAPHVDKHDGIQAASMLRRGIDADSFVMILDAHVKTVANEDELKEYKSGDFQRQCDEEGACELGVLSDCLVCHRINAKGKITMMVLPYRYHGKKGGIAFAWTKFGGDALVKTVDEEVDNINIEGNIPDALRHVMTLESFTDNVNMQSVAEILQISGKDRQLYHTTRVIYGMLISEGFAVLDYMNHHLPWEKFKEQVG